MRLAVKAKALGRQLLDELETLVTPDRLLACTVPDGSGDDFRVFQIWYRTTGSTMSMTVIRSRDPDNRQRNRPERHDASRLSQSIGHPRPVADCPTIAVFPCWWTHHNSGSSGLPMTPAFFQYKEKNSYRAETCEQVAAACLALVHMMHCPW
jgi:hypothetical protein